MDETTKTQRERSPLLCSEKPVVKGKNLPGAVNVLPIGLTEILAMRESNENNKTQRSCLNSVQRRTESSINYVCESTTSSYEQKSSNMIGSYNSQSLPPKSVEEHSAFCSNTMKNTEHQELQMQSNSISHSNNQQIIQDISNVPHEGTRSNGQIQQTSLKQTLQSAITDIESEMTKYKQDENNNTTSSPSSSSSKTEKDKDRFTKPQSHMSLSVIDGSHTTTTKCFQNLHHTSQCRLRMPHEFKGRPNSCVDLLDETEIKNKRPEFEIHLPEIRPLVSNASADFSKDVIKEDIIRNEDENIPPHISDKTDSKILCSDKNEDPNLHLKRRNPHQMFTDSSYYSSKYHPSVAEQVEKAHKLSSSLYDDGNSQSKGQQMYLKRLNKLLDESDKNISIHHDKVPNLKLVMNPHGKVRDWGDILDPEEMDYLANSCKLSNETAQHMIQNLELCKGRGGELYAKRRKCAEKWTSDKEFDGASQFQAIERQEFVSVVQEQEDKKMRAVKEQQSMVDSSEHMQKNKTDRALKKSTQRIDCDNHQFLQQQQEKLVKIQTERSQHMYPLPRNQAPCTLKGKPLIQTLDIGKIHNEHGIDVWHNVAPKPWIQTNTLSSRKKSTALNQCQTKQRQDCLAATKPTKTNLLLDIMDAKSQLDFSNEKYPVVVSSSFRERNELSNSQSSQKLASHTHPKKEQTQTKCRNDQNVINQSAVLMEHRTKSPTEDVLMKEKKKQEYVEWFQQQQHLFQYDCSVKYEEKMNNDHNSFSMVHEDKNTMKLEINSNQSLQAEFKELSVMQNAKENTQDNDAGVFANQCQNYHPSNTLMKNQQPPFQPQMEEKIQKRSEIKNESRITTQQIAMQNKNIHHGHMETQADIFETTNSTTVINENENLEKLIFGGIQGEHNVLINPDTFKYEKHTVKDLVHHFSKKKTKEVPFQYLPQQNTANIPPLSYLQEQAKQKHFEFRKNECSTDNVDMITANPIEEMDEKLISRRRGSLKEYLLMNVAENKAATECDGNRVLLDPSSILKVDRFVTDNSTNELVHGRAATREFKDNTTIQTNMWDDHNSIARGWNNKFNSDYHPVTFRKIYFIERQLPIMASEKLRSNNLSNPGTEDKQFIGKRKEEVETKTQL